MKDFTLVAYKGYLEAIKYSYTNILRFDEYFLADPKPESFCIIRHDVDRRPKKALQMAQLENRMGLTATYYFRAKSHVFKPDVIKAIEALGHEIGYHYESLSDARGNTLRATQDFEQKLKGFRNIVPVKTICMHGSPLKPYDNRDMWRNHASRKNVFHVYDILGEVYLDIDYSDIAYITDTGRNWRPTEFNVRDMVDSGICPDLRDGYDLYSYFTSNPHPRSVFLVHPERWSNQILEHCLSFLFDTTANIAKDIVRFTGQKQCRTLSRKAHKT